MSQPSKSNFSVDGGQAKEDENLSTYTPISETNSEFRNLKNSLGKSKEKLSPDGAEEKLLPKEEEAKIVTRVDMADAKFVVEDHRNGDAKIELDANKRQFTGLSKEELMKYADDPFWVNLRWCMFILFWAMWLCMLAGAITIIVRAPKCPLQPERPWFEVGPLVDMGDAPYEEIESQLSTMKDFLVKGIFVDVPAPYVDEPSAMETFKKLAAKAKENGIKVIADLIPNYVNIDHDWFKWSKEKNPNYTDYFVWRTVKEYDADKGQPKLPTETWKSTLHEPAWTLEETRNEFYLHQFNASQPDLNFENPHVVQEFDNAIRRWMKAGANGIRLNKARFLLVNATLPEEHIAVGKDVKLNATHMDYGFWQNKHTTDQTLLDVLLTRWLGVVDSASETPGSAVFTLAEDRDTQEWYRLNNTSLRSVKTALRPPSTIPLVVGTDMINLAAAIRSRISKWPAMQLKSDGIEADEELALFAMLLPAAPVLEPRQLRVDNDSAASEMLWHVAGMRADATLQHGKHHVTAVPDSSGASPALIACARWKAGKSGYVAVYNPGPESRRANLSQVDSLPETLAVHHMSHAARLRANQSSTAETVDDVLVPARSTVILSYVPKKTVEQ